MQPTSISIAIILACFLAACNKPTPLGPSPQEVRTYIKRLLPDYWETKDVALDPHIDAASLSGRVAARFTLSLIKPLYRDATNEEIVAEENRGGVKRNDVIRFGRAEGLQIYAIATQPGRSFAIEAEFRCHKVFNEWKIDGDFPVPRIEGGQLNDGTKPVVLGSAELMNLYALVQQRLKSEKQEWLTKRTNREVEFKAALAKGKKIALLLSIPNFAQSREHATITITSDSPRLYPEKKRPDYFDLTVEGMVRFDDGKPHQISRNSNPFLEAKARIEYTYAMQDKDNGPVEELPVEMVVLLETGEVPWRGSLQQLEGGAICLYPKQ